LYLLQFNNGNEVRLVRAPSKTLPCLIVNHMQAPSTYHVTHLFAGEGPYILCAIHPLSVLVFSSILSIVIDVFVLHK
jgi:hypothetical protein